MAAVSVGGAIMKTALSTALAAIGIVLLVSQVGRAEVIYTYTGNDFTTVQEGYSTSDRVTGEIILSSALPDNATDFAPTVISYSFTDGIQTMTNLNSLLDVAQFYTNATGSITQWLFQSGVTNNPIILTRNFPSESIVDEGVGTNDASFGLVYNNPGSWSGPTPVPEPATWTLMLGGFGMLVLMSLRSRGSAHRWFGGTTSTAGARA
jgi:PEP-CTERM motif